MPKTKIIKTKEEKSSETFFPVDEDDLKRTIEKRVKSLSEEKTAKRTTEKKYKGPQKKPEEKSKKILKRKTTKKRSKFTKIRKISRAKRVIKPYNPPKIKLKPKGYELIITEKPQAATKIAAALSGGKAKTVTTKGINHYELDRNGKKIVVVCAVGHLFTLHQKIRGSDFPVFNISWEPNYLVRKGAEFTKKYFDTILNLAKGAGSITVATDYDVEGEVIGLNVVRFLCGQKDANRMKFSTLTPTELNKAYDTKSKVINWGQAVAGETRHYLDWYYGINLSRALMAAIKTTGKFRIMSAGRVQGPTLKLIVDKEKEIQKFKPVSYWQVFITVKNSELTELKHNKDIFEKKDLDKFKNLVGKEAVCTTTKKQDSLPPGAPFNLTTLQTESYKFFGITPARVLQVAQSLYLAGLISYPRTSSQKLPSSIKYKPIRDKLAKELNFTKLMKKDKPIQGKKDDLAHPSIYPTGNKQILSGEDEKIYNLIVQRFLSLFCNDALIDKKKIEATVDNLKFSANGTEVTKKEWMNIYPSKLKENSIPDIEGKVKIIKTRIEDKETQPPRRYSQASIISELEKRNLGTKATRANILETLYDRGYIQEKAIVATPLGISLINTLAKYSPIIIDQKLTRSFEDSMDKIRSSTKDWTKKEEKILEKAKKTINNISKDFERHDKSIGKALVKANEELRDKLKEENTLNECPTCKKGNLIITYSKKNKKQFVACDAYPKCTQTYSLPPNGIIKRTEKTCDECGWPKLIRLSKGKRPWEFCFNPNCPTNKERIEKYKKDLVNKS